MKKSIVAILLSVTFLCVGFSCGKGGEESLSDSTVESIPPEEEYAFVNDFETDYDLNAVALYDYLGRAELNGEAEYVKTGEKSLKLCVQPSPSSSTKGYAFISFTNVYRNVDKSDFSDKKKIEFYVYNAQNKITRVSVRLVYKRRYYGEKCSAYKFITLNCGWNKCEYIIDDTVLSNIPLVTLEGTSDEIPLVIGMDLAFNPSSSTEYDFYYVDGVTVE